MIASTRSSSVDELERVDAGVAERRAQLGLALRGGRGEALAEAAVVRVDEDLLAGLRILDHQQAEVGQLRLQRIVQAHRDHLVALRELRERAAPSPAR